MSNYDNTNRGSIWANQKKQKESHPEFTGSLNVEGVEYWVSAWKRKPDANPNAPALSFSVKRKDDNSGQSPQQASAAQNAAPQQQQNNDFPDDDIPF